MGDRKNTKKKTLKMANYEYECKVDGVINEVEFPIGTAPEVTPCPVCAQDAPRKFSTFRPIFRGDGWGGK
jgi:predicted nucleic acid-binding Zn ribbon protein